MALPVTFVANDTARSADVNADFNYIMGIVGSSSSSSRLDLPGDILLGPRNNQQISGKHDASSFVNSTKFLHIGMNLEYYDSGGGVYKYRRMVNGQVGMSYHFSTTGFEVWATDAASSSDPNPTMAERIGMYTSYMYMPESYSIFSYNSADPSTGGRNNQDHRTTLQYMNTPGMLYNGTAVTSGTNHRTATNYGVSKYAIGVLISARIYASSPARLKFYRDEASPNDINGFEVDTIGGGSTQSAAGQGFVPLGVGAYKGRFIVEAVGNISYAKVGIIGYSI